MRIVFLSVDDEFAGAMQVPLFASHPEWVVGSVISTCPIYKKSALGAVWFVLRKSGPRYLFEMARMKLLRKFTHRTPKATPLALARVHGVPVYWTADINAEESLATLAAFQPDFVISTNFSHYIGRAAREVARRGTWNLHKSYLPHYRGMAPSFFALLEGAAQVGATLHLVDRGFDTGDILCQVAVAVGAGDTVYTLNRKTSEAGGKMLAEFLARGDLSEIRATPQPEGNGGARTYPTPDEVRAFFRKGLRF